MAVRLRRLEPDESRVVRLWFDVAQGNLRRSIGGALMSLREDAAKFRAGEIIRQAEFLVDAVAATCDDFDTETLEAIAANPTYKDGWVGLLIRDFLVGWRGA